MHACSKDAARRYPRYKDFPKHDLRHYFALLLAIDRLGNGATMHYLAIDLDCTRAEVSRAVEAIRQNLMVTIEKPGVAYRIVSWGVLSKQAVKRCMADWQARAAKNSNEQAVGKGTPAWTREFESELAKRCVKAALSGIAARSADEADVFRFVAQLVKTHHHDAARRLEQSNSDYFEKHRTKKTRTFPEVVRAGLVQDVSRFRNVMEHHLKGARSW